MNLGYFYYKVLMEKIINIPKYQEYLKTFKKEKAPNLEQLKDEKNNLYKDLFNFTPTILEEEFEYRGFEKKEFTLNVQGKGLFIGIGYTHEIPSVKGQLINGFYFDYTTGLPLIPGSSIKGTIKSIFPYKDEELEEILNKKSKEKNYEEIEFLYKEINKGKKENIKKLLDLEEEKIFKLRDEIFEYGDIFLDAYIVSDGKIFDVDYFAPHPDKFSHPVPLKFLKIKPNVKFKFRFLLKKDLSILNVNQRLRLFREIIIQNGLGAKTNENYGRFYKEHRKRNKK